ncbi:MAG: YfdX family protein [Thiobacillus sp.]|nr:YfdX family protein [Thiobacillus sp.]
MNSLHPMQHKPLVILLTAAMTATTLAMPIVQAATLEESISVHPTRSLTPKEEEVLSSAGAKVLQHVAEARARLANKDRNGASEELGQADKLLDIIQAAVPPTVVQDRIQMPGKRLEYENSRTVKPDLIPLYSSLDTMSDYMPLKPAPTGHSAKPAANPKSARAEEKTDSAVQYTEVDLPLQATRDRIDAAKGYLAAGKTSSADQSLRAVEQSVVYVSVAVEQPLFEARNLLERAAIDLEGGRKDLAHQNLQAAITQLQRAEQSSDVYTREGAQVLLKEARGLQSDMQHGSVVGTRLRGLWQHAKAYAERATESVRTGWARVRSESPFKRELIEVKRYLADAEIDLFVGKEPARARHDLQQALSRLDGAAIHARTYYTDEIYKQEIAGLQATLHGMLADPAKANSRQFELAKGELGRMIQTL